jgi:probable phosphoglycerate mutase
VTETQEQIEYHQKRYKAPPTATTLVLVRHGESAPVRLGRPVPLTDGQDDPDLAPEGRVHAEQVARRLAGEQVDHIYVTSLRRTVETAAPLVARVGITPTVVPDLREINLGSWEGGRLRRAFADRHPLTERLYAEQRWDVIPGAESPESFTERIRAAIVPLADKHKGGRVVIFTHGGVIAELICQATGCRPFAFLGADNASISEIVVTERGWLVRRFNDISHLD